MVLVNISMLIIPALVRRNARMYRCMAVFAAMTLLTRSIMLLRLTRLCPIAIRLATWWVCRVEEIRRMECVPAEESRVLYGCVLMLHLCNVFVIDPVNGVARVCFSWCTDVCDDGIGIINM